MRHGLISALAFCLLLTACGFEPMYGAHEGMKNTPLAGAIVIEVAPDRNGQMFKSALEDRLNPEALANAHPEYHLQVTLHKTLIPTVVKSDGTIQRYDVRFDSTFSLHKNAVLAPALTGDIHRMASYNVAINGNFATYEAQQDTIARLLQELAEDYVLRLSSYFAAQPIP